MRLAVLRYEIPKHYNFAIDDITEALNIGVGDYCKGMEEDPKELAKLMREWVRKQQESAP